jgi:hypothetical protein
LQQRAQPKSYFNGTAGKEIPELIRWSGITGKRDALFCLTLDPVINDNTTQVIRPEIEGGGEAVGFRP